jgi:hypothetical protein
MPEKKTESERIGDELREEKETYALFDTVKIDIYNEWKKANENLRDIEEKDLPSGLKEIPYQYYGPRFVSRIMSLYRSLKNKVEYINDKNGQPVFKKLYELDEYELKEKNTAEMTFKEAKEYFDVMTRMLEKLGVTRFEFEKLDSKEKIMRDAFSSD